MSMPYPSLSPEGTKALDALLHARATDGSVPALFYASTNAKETIYESQEGLKVFGDSSSGQVDRDTTLQIYSMTKFITCVAGMILVDRGLAALDDEALIEKYCPELGKLEIITGFDADDKPTFKPATKKITVRMLMSHSAGMSYPFTSELVAKWSAQNPKGGQLTADATIDSNIMPLAYEPGTSWKYSISIDWVGILITRISGLSLEEFFKQNIFSKVPGGMPDTSFYPRKDIKDRLLQPSSRMAGPLAALPTGSWNPVFGHMKPREQNPDKISSTFLSGGGGLFGTTKDYLALLQTILRSDPRIAKEDRIAEPLLSPSSYLEFFKPSLPKSVDGEATTCHAELAKMMVGEQYVQPVPTAETVDHSIALSLNLVDSSIGRNAMSGTWAGAAKTQFWLDPTTGVAGICNTQLWAANPDPWNVAYNDFESTLYKHLV